MPACAYLLSRFYTRAELVFRISIFVNAVCYLLTLSRSSLILVLQATLAGAIGGLMASGFLAIGEINSTLTSWRNIFFFEGIISIVVSVLAWFILADSPESARWLTAEEREVSNSVTFLVLYAHGSTAGKQPSPCRNCMCKGCHREVQG